MIVKNYKAKKLNMTAKIKNDSKKLVTVCAKYTSISKRYYWVLSENGMVNG